MKNIMHIEKTLKRMAYLFHESDLLDWANALEKLRQEIRVSPSVTVARILALYGGMGSLNDLVLYKNGRLLVAENVELDALRSELYQLCHEAG